MAIPFLGEIKMISFDFAPKGWAFCNGQFLPINQNQALFSILGTTYGGNGQTTFALPDLRGRVATHWGDGLTLGQRGGEESHTLTQPEAAHWHAARAVARPASAEDPAGNLWAIASAAAYGQGADTYMGAGLVGNTGGSQPHSNMQPYAVVNFVIALQGIFPSQ